MTEPNACASRRIRSLTVGSVSPDSRKDDFFSLESSETLQDRSFDGIDKCSGTFHALRSPCTTTAVNDSFQRMGGVKLTSRATSGRLVRSISLPANLSSMMETSLDSSVPYHMESKTVLRFIAENQHDEETTSATTVARPVASLDVSDDMCKSHGECDMSDETKVSEQLAELTTTLVAPIPQRKPTTSTDELVDLIDYGNWMDVERLCEEEPDIARREVTMMCQGEKCSALLLHLVCSRRETPLSLVDALVTANPASVMQPEQRRGRLPIHIATLKGASAAVVRYLARAVPTSLQIQDAEGNLPMHYAAMCGTNETLHILLQAHADAAKVMNARCKLPLHVLCARWVDESENPVSIGILKSMLTACPESISTCDSKGRLPLHIACNMANPRLDVIRLLLSWKPETILVRDEDKCTPLQLAMRFCSTPDNDLCVAFLQDVTDHERQRQKRKAAKRMARRLLYLGRNNSSNNKTPVVATLKPVLC